MQNAGVWYDVKAQKGQHGEDTAAAAGAAAGPAVTSDE